MNIIKQKEKENSDIKNLEIYLSRMEKGMDDKLFFLPYLNDIKSPILFVDFGCGNGTLLKTLLTLYPDMQAVGIENSIHMAALTQKNLHEYLDRFQFYNSLEQFKGNLIGYLNKYTIVLNLSSVMHEIHYYLSNEEIDEFYRDLKEIPFDYIFIRDMYCPNTTRLHTKFTDYNKLLTYIEDNINTHKYFETQLKQFQQQFGDIVIQKNFLHFLMKYKYLENWDRECNENYFAEIRFDEIERDYEVLYKKMYQLPYLTQLWKDDFDIEIEENTHIKCVYKRK